MTEVVVCCGLGGTGKTTTAAAIALSRARAGQRVVVLTIDPARRLSDALHLPLLGTEPTSVPLRDFAVRGTLDALMLDRKGTWDAVVRRFSPDDDVAERLLANRYYRAVSTRLTGSHEYMAIEKLAELVETGRWDVVVVDTPPTQHLLDFLDAPERILRVFDRSVLSALVEPEPGFLGAVTRRAVGLVNRVAGDSVMADIHEFFRLISGLSGHFRERGKKVGEILARATWLLVVNARAPDRADLESFLGALSDRGLSLSGLVVSRVSPEPPPAASREEVSGWLAGIANADGWAAALLAFHQAAASGAALDRAAAARLAARAGGVRTWTIPDAPELVGTLEGLVELSASLA